MCYQALYRETLPTSDLEKYLCTSGQRLLWDSDSGDGEDCMSVGTTQEADRLAGLSG